MRYFLCAAALMLMLAPTAAFAQSAPNLVTGQVPTAAQWNSYFAAKQDYNPNFGCAFSPCVPPIATTPNSILETNTSGTPSFSTLLPSGMTYPNPQFSGTTAGGILSGNFSLSTSGQAQITNTTPSTSPMTGAATIAGGLGVGGGVNVGGDLTVGGNLNVPAPNESANTVYAGPSSGSPAAPSFRALAQADLPNVTPSGGNTASPLPTILGRIISVTDFGAACNGVTDDTAALQNAFSTAAANKLTIRLPSGTCLFSSPITVGAGGYWGIRGASDGSSLLLYDGASTTATLITIGSLSTQSPQLTLSDFRIDSTVKMTAGDALHLVSAVDSVLSNVILTGDLDQSAHNLWNGFDFDSYNTLHLNGCNVSVQNTGLTAWSATVAIDLFVDHCEISHSATGIHAGGGVGGLVVSNSDILLNTNNVLIDSALSSSTQPEQILLSPSTYVDSATNAGIEVDITTAPTSCNLELNSWVSATNPGNDVSLLADPCNTMIRGNPIQDTVAGNGIYIGAAVPSLVIGGDIHGNAGYGVNCGVAQSLFLTGAIYSNTAGNLSSNCSINPNH